MRGLESCVRDLLVDGHLDETQAVDALTLLAPGGWRPEPEPKAATAGEWVAAIEAGLDLSVLVDAPSTMGKWSTGAAAHASRWSTSA